MISVKEVRKAQALLSRALENLKEETAKKVEQNQPMKGVKPIGKNGAIVSASLLMNGNSWSPSTYIPSSQINAIKSATKNIASFDAFVKKIEEMTSKKYIKVGNDTVYLNEKTLDALNSVLAEINE